MSQFEVIAPRTTHTVFPVEDYDLAATLASGQAFRWRETNGVWQGVVGSRFVQLRQTSEGILAEAAFEEGTWDWLIHYLQLNIHLAGVLATFPQDEPMRAAVTGCRGLRLLRQDPWECLASFILSSTKQIVQIQQIVESLCARFGEPLAAPPGSLVRNAFPSPDRIARATEAELRECKMGFRAPYLKQTAASIASGNFNLERIGKLDLDTARAELLKLPGVGRKIADCVLLFAYGFPAAFPVDVWVMKGLRELYFRRRRVQLKRLIEFSSKYFGPNGGYAQQYLFHYMRMRGKLDIRTPNSGASRNSLNGKKPKRTSLS